MVGVLPAPLWIVLFLIAGIIVGFTLFFADSGEPAVVQALLMGSEARQVVGDTGALPCDATGQENPWTSAFRNSGLLDGTAGRQAVRMSDETTPGDGRTTKERMFAGELYIADDPALVAENLRAMRLIEAYNASPAADPDARGRILDVLLAAFGEGSEIRPPLYCDYGYNLRVGARTFVNFGLVALDVAPVTIGDDVQIGPRVQLLTPTHPVEAEPRRAKWEAALPIAIGDNVWLGGGAIVLPGVSIGENTVVGAGAVVTRDLPAGVVAVGNPARVIRSL